MNRRPVVVFLPVHDEVATVATVIGRVPAEVSGHPVEVIVVDDGSGDGSGDVAVAAGAKVVVHNHNRGLGAAVRSGFTAALGRDPVATAFLDADGEYDPAELPRLLAPILAGDADYVVGSRFSGTIESMLVHRRVGNRVLTLVTSAFARRRLGDAQSGFRALGADALAAARIVHDYNYAQVLTLDLLRQGYRYAEVPISYRRRAHGRSFVKLGCYLRRVLPAMLTVVRTTDIVRTGPTPAQRLGRWVCPATFVIVALAGQLAVGMRGAKTASVTGDEPFYLLTTQSLRSDGDLDLRDEYANHEERVFWDGTIPLWKQMTPAPDGRLLAPHEPGLSLLAVPAYAMGGLRGVQRFLVLVWAAALACAAVLARRAGAPPWAACLAATVVGAGAPGVVYASQVYPEAAAALALAIGLLAVTDTRARPVVLALAMVALAWLGVKYVPIGAVVVAAFGWRYRTDRRALLVAAALLGIGGAHAVWWHFQTFGGLTPYGTNVVWSGDGTASILAAHIDVGDRGHRLAGLFLDARFGLLRWLPMAVLAAWGVRRTTALYSGVVAVCVMLAAFVSITMMGWSFPGRMLVAALPALAVLVALGAARLPRASMVLGAWSLAIAVVVVIATRTGQAHLAVDPWMIGFPLLSSSVWPDFRVITAGTWLTTTAWFAGLGAGPALVGRRNGPARQWARVTSAALTGAAALGLAVVVAGRSPGEDRPGHVTTDSRRGASGLPADGGRSPVDGGASVGG